MKTRSYAAAKVDAADPERGPRKIWLRECRRGCPDAENVSPRSLVLPQRPLAAGRAVDRAVGTQRVPLAGNVLETGGGSGTMAEGILRTHPRVRITMTDIDPAMVRGAQERFAGCPRATVHRADATRLPYADESFDVVASFLMLHHVLDWEVAVEEASRVLRPAGMFVGYDLTASRWASMIHRIDGSAHRLIERGTLEPVLRQSGLEVQAVKYALCGLVVRFVARKK